MNDVEQSEIAGVVQFISRTPGSKRRMSEPAQRSDSIIHRHHNAVRIPGNGMHHVGHPVIPHVASAVHINKHWQQSLICLRSPNIQIQPILNTTSLSASPGRSITQTNPIPRCGFFRSFPPKRSEWRTTVGNPQPGPGMIVDRCPTNGTGRGLDY